VVHNTSQNTSDNHPSYPPDSNHCSGVVLGRGKWDGSKAMNEERGEQHIKMRVRVEKGGWENVSLLAMKPLVSMVTLTGYWATKRRNLSLAVFEQ